MSYDIGVPTSYWAVPLAWLDDSSGLRWDWRFTDLLPARYLEQWLPSNLIHDPFALELELRLNTDVAHTLITNAEVTEVGEHHWKLMFSPVSTSLSPMLMVLPADEVISESNPHVLANGQQVEVEVHRREAVPEAMEDLVAVVVETLDALVLELGDFPRDRVTVVFWDELAGMEYEGAASTHVAYLSHELFHSWWGRWLRSARASDGWLDEAWNVYNTDAQEAFLVELQPAAPPIVLCSSNPWTRVTPGEAYDHGLLFFAHLAAVMGLDALRSAMAGFYEEHAGGLVTTQQLERYLYCRDEDVEVARAFHRMVYGRVGEPMLSDIPSCD